MIQRQPQTIAELQLKRKFRVDANNLFASTFNRLKVMMATSFSPRSIKQLWYDYEGSKAHCKRDADSAPFS